MDGTTEAVVAAWCALERAAAFLPGDRAAIEATDAPRGLVVDLVRARAPHADLFHASAVLGRLLADHGGSPTLAASAIDDLRELLPELDAGTARAARAALAEGFAAARSEATRAEAAARWDFPACAVPLEDAGIAIAAGFPEDDEDALAAWAARVANAVARAGYRRAVLAGGERACAALFDALELAGVKVRTTSPPAPLGRR
jgi:hypothetical protein